MGNGLIAFLVAVSATVWIYSKLMRSTGSNAKNSITASVIAGGLIFFLVLFIANQIPN